MVARKNVTLSLDEELLREARILAAMEGRSLSELLRRELRRLVRGRRDRLAALRAVEDLLDHPPGRIEGPLPGREALHER